MQIDIQNRFIRLDPKIQKIKLETNDNQEVYLALLQVESHHSKLAFCLENSIEAYLSEQA